MKTGYKRKEEKNEDRRKALINIAATSVSLLLVARGFVSLSKNN